MVPCEGSCHKEYTYESFIFYGLKVMAKVKVFVHAVNADAYMDVRAMTLAPWTFVPACFKVSSATIFNKGVNFHLRLK